MDLTRTQIKIRNLVLITCVSVAAIAAPLSLWVVVEQFSSSMVHLVQSEVNRVHHLLAKATSARNEQEAKQFAQEAVNNLVGGFLDYADFYAVSGIELAEAKTELGRKHYSNSGDDSHKGLNPGYSIQSVTGDVTFLNIQIPIHLKHDDPTSDLIGTLEVGRAVPDWRRKQVVTLVLLIAGISALSALACGLIIYPMIKRLIHTARSKSDQVAESHINLLEALGRAVAKKESNTGAHNYRVTWIAVRIAESLGLDKANIQNLIAGAFLHDVGKIAIPDSILLKPGKLTDEEWIIMRDHVLHGEEIVKGIGWLEEGSSSVVSGHHERWDGSGYPRQLAGESIPLLARIFAVADVFDALASERPYKKQQDYKEVMGYILEQSGKHFDPAIVQQFQKMAFDIYQRASIFNEKAAKDSLNRYIYKYFGVGLIA